MWLGHGGSEGLARWPGPRSAEYLISQNFSIKRQF